MVIGSFSANDADGRRRQLLPAHRRPLAAGGAGRRPGAQQRDLFLRRKDRGPDVPGRRDTEESSPSRGQRLRDGPEQQRGGRDGCLLSGLQLLEGAPPMYSIACATSQVDGAAPAAMTQPTTPARAFLGALSTGGDRLDQAVGVRARCSESRRPRVDRIVVTVRGQASMKKFRREAVALPPLVVMAGALSSWHPIAIAQATAPAQPASASASPGRPKKSSSTGRSLRASEQLVQERIQDA